MEIKNCPFCGRQGYVVTDYKGCFWVRCSVGGENHESDIYESESEAIQAWNNRVE